MNSLLKRARTAVWAVPAVVLNAFLLSAPVLAQTGAGGAGGGTSSGGTDVSTSTTTTSTGVEWYGQWWIWAVGVAVFLIIVIALTNRGGRTNP